jgi:hypothetical protein
LDVELAFGTTIAEIPILPIESVVFDAVGTIIIGVGTVSGIELLATSVFDDTGGTGVRTTGLVPVAGPGTTVGGVEVGGPAYGTIV